MYVCQLSIVNVFRQSLALFLALSIYSSRYPINHFLIFISDRFKKLSSHKAFFQMKHGPSIQRPVVYPSM